MVRRSRGSSPLTRGKRTATHPGSPQTEGSSPLTRGKRRRSRIRHDGRGLIPAHAGKTVACGSLAVTVGAHPRSRGENGAVTVTVSFGSGSSPLTRGKREGSDRVPSPSRLIPAHAGKTHDVRHGARDERAHPRSRGENGVEGVGLVGDPGSSPLTRGKQNVARYFASGQGLIPAHAGKTT